jgi:predicted RNase H-like HicB family nuclease
MRDYHINIFYSEEDEGYIADIPDLGACSAFGERPAEALQEVQKAKELWLEAAFLSSSCLRGGEGIMRKLHPKYTLTESR